MSAPEPDERVGAPSEPRGDAILGRVADPAALDEERGGIATFETRAPGRWSGVRVRVSLPRSLTCRSCEGGGCDPCGRSGAYRLPSEPAARVIELEVPGFARPTVVVRVPRPFGEGSPVRQVFVVFEECATPDARLEPVEPVPEATALATKPDVDLGRWALVAAVAAGLVALVRLLVG